MEKIIPYGRQLVDESDIAAVAEVLRGDWLTQGPGVVKFEDAFAAMVRAKHAIAVNSGTAALHAAMFALGIGSGDEVIVPPITFTATANCVVFQDGTPVFADVDAATGLIDPARVAEKITKRTKAIIAVDYAGHPCDYDALKKIADAHGIALVADACHALGATYKDRPVGSIAKLNCFSFHPVKHIATGEGGMITTDDDALAAAMRDFRTHGISKDANRFRGLGSHTGDLAEQGPWYYEMLSLGFNCRISDINCALGLSQMKKLDRFVTRRRDIAAAYYRGLAGLPNLRLPPSDLCPLTSDPLSRHSFHLYPVLIDFAALGKTRTQVMNELRTRGIGTQVHYIPVCLQPFYRERCGLKPGHCPCAEKFYAQELSIPMFSGMSDIDVEHVLAGIRGVVTAACA